ncbi:hypothetical protein BY457_12626 [Marinilabilia salmonicolor]|jgi:hypothetical protein|uniref:hypothetical protein n=1 Tax=Marinilabilia salmonicolor TaxID=989 RepID=UPI000D0571E6|nr:hypothetical protein [Marinilabilia salmonicolor]PRY91351.1 hypothetical protein BY457_12626 [Marinilabilia salmonicolor]
MKKGLLFFIAIFIWLPSNGQTVEQDILREQWNTLNTSSANKGKWVRIATCTNSGHYQDYGTVFEMFGNGSANSTFYYGKLIARFKRQSSEAGPATSMALILYDSNIGSDNIVGIRNGATIDVFLRINMTYTRFFFRRIMKGYSTISALKEEPFMSDLPSGDYIIQCTDGAGSFGNIKANSIVVSETIEAKEVKISSAPGADFVFSEDYPLRDLKQVEDFIKDYKHLPEIPSAHEMATSGVNLAEMNKLLLQKIEELTLYIIKQDKERACEREKQERLEKKMLNVIDELEQIKKVVVESDIK